MEREHPPVLVPEPVQPLDFLRHDHRLGGDRVVLPAAAAPAAGVGQHMGERLEVDIGGRDVLGIVRPVERPIAAR